MTTRPSEGTALVSFDALAFSRLTWMGLLVVAIGWALLLGAAAVADIVVARNPRSFAITFHADLIDIAKTIIASGFGLAIIGALQTGFGTLNRFFGAVLMRSGQRDTAPTRPVASDDARPYSTAVPIESQPYRMLPDGSVEVETIVGTRIFKTMAEARDFI